MRTFKPMFVAALLALPFAAVAQEQVFPPAPTTAGSVLKSLVSPESVLSVLGVVGSIVGGFSFFSARRKRILATAAYYAFHIVEDIGLEMEGDDAFDKTAVYLKKVDEWLLAHGYRPSKPGDVAALTLQAQAQHGVEVAKAKVAEAAAVATVDAQVAAAPTPS